MILCFQKLFFAEEKSGWGDTVIGFTFKTLSKSYLAAADINKLKKNGINKLLKMSDEKFRKRYAEVYAVIKDLPPPVRTKYGLTEKMTKKQAIKSLAGLDKKQIYEIINAVPNSVIAERFREAVAGDKGSKPSGITDQISGL
ncbi:MAG: hypothetical protein COS68_02655 [Elusimicrobia bacterium CG06_land_8_20_14_3_00_38_11]|nr:MAG: hypothetical protein COS68_02655 [Elusimicrobia bacterium CG06_land_8_20_14_3_00_38_11]